LFFLVPAPVGKQKARKSKNDKESSRAWADDGS
jgi:hypothetical protein